MDEDVFQRYSRYYDLLYRDKDYDAEADYVARTLRSADPTARKLLEFGSGTGRHGRLLARRGFDVFGVERSESMVAAARGAPPLPSQSGGGSFDCVKGDIKTIELDCVFDSVVSLFHVVSYQTRNSDLLDTFANAARYLNSGGVFFFDVWHGPAVLNERPSVRVKRVEDENTHLTRIAEPELDVNAGVVTYATPCSPSQKSTAASRDSERSIACATYFLPRSICWRVKPALTWSAARSSLLERRLRKARGELRISFANR